MAPAKHRDLNSLPGKLLPWFERHARDLPWRTLPADRAVGNVQLTRRLTHAFQPGGGFKGTQGIQ